MATLTPGRDMLVIRLVYDGPPRSGKTTSLRLLAGGLSRRMISPEEANGRTLLFDWVDYVGGSYEGLPIRCQIVSVPGQRVLASRRRALLATADAVVFVADTTHRRMGETEECLRELGAFLATRSRPRPGVVLQANKRDEDDAEPLEVLRARLGAGGGEIAGRERGIDGFGGIGEMGSMALVESIATEGTGIREAFVLSVRLALDRVRELAAAGALEARQAEADSADELRAQIRAAEEEDQTTAAATPPDEAPLAVQALREVLAGEVDLAGATPPASPRAGVPPTAPGPPRLPGTAAPSGRVWPPVEGRLVLHAASSSIDQAPHSGMIHRRPDGSWQVRVGAWHLHSQAEHEFLDAESGRAELLRWARVYANRAKLSPRRCIVLAETGGDRWRLWQVVHGEESLRQRLAAALAAAQPEPLAEALLAAAARLLQARELFRRGDPLLPCRLGTISASAASAGRAAGDGSDGEPAAVYIGLLPPRTWQPAPGEFETDDAALIRREIEPVLRPALSALAFNVPGVLDALAARQDADASWRRPYEAIANLLIGT